jgi:WD40 repeat protein
VSADGQSIATASLDTTVKIFNVMSRNMTKELNHFGKVHKVQFDKDNAYLLSTGEDGVYLWDITRNYKQTRIGELKHGNIHEFKELINRSATFSECGELVIVKSQ